MMIVSSLCRHARIRHASVLSAIRLAIVSASPSRSVTTSSSSPADGNPALLPSTPARTRFAPSPTGYLHLGSLRTALFNFLLAKKTGGQFLLRLEDTDQSRTIPGAEEKLYSDLEWAGITWDEGPLVGGPHAPYRQSERTALYQTHARNLVDSGHAYRCFCSAERLQALATQQLQTGGSPSYDRRCTHLSKEESDERASKGEAHVIRLLAPKENPSFHDLVYGKMKNARTGRSSPEGSGDTILLKSDGHPTYHLANVVDDHFMGITHVIRGSEWLPSTSKHVTLYQAFGWQPPQFAHVALLTDVKGNKLSKRDLDGIGISHYRSQGILPGALRNYAVLLGWSHNKRSDVMNMDSMIYQFNMKFTKGNAKVTPEKLKFLQQCHAEKLIEKNPEKFVNDILAELEKQDWPPEQRFTPPYGMDLKTYITELLQYGKDRYTTAQNFIQDYSYMFRKLEPQSPAAFHWYIKACIDTVFSRYPEAPSAWNRADLLATMMALKDKLKTQRHESFNFADVWHYLRAMLMGRDEGMQVLWCMELLGRDECLRRMQIKPVAKATKGEQQPVGEPEPADEQKLVGEDLQEHVSAEQEPTPEQEPKKISK